MCFLHLSSLERFFIAWKANMAVFVVETQRP
jgi:hypothetical protein